MLTSAVAFRVCFHLLPHLFLNSWSPTKMLKTNTPPPQDLQNADCDRDTDPEDTAEVIGFDADKNPSATVRSSTAHISGSDTHIRGKRRNTLDDVFISNLSTLAPISMNAVSNKDPRPGALGQQGDTRGSNCTREAPTSSYGLVSRPSTSHLSLPSLTMSLATEAHRHWEERDNLRRRRARSVYYRRTDSSLRCHWPGYR